MASFARMGEEIRVAPVPVPSPGQDWAKRLEKTIERGAHHLLSIQAEEGYWQGELEADTTLESDYIYYLLSRWTVRAQRYLQSLFRPEAGGLHHRSAAYG